MNKIIWDDKETGGLYPEQCDTTQIAIILDVDGKLVEEANILLRPSDPSRVNPQALAVQKKTLEQVMAHKYSQKEGYELYRDTLAKWTADGVKAAWGGQNVPFDVGFGQALFAANGNAGGLKAFFSGETVDTRHVAEDWKRKGRLMIRNAKLGTICDALGVKLGDGAHDALNDIRATREAFYEMQKRFVPAAA